MPNGMGGFYFLLFLAASLTHVANAQARDSSGVPFVSGPGIGLAADSHDVEYLVNITLGGQNFRVQLDSGSSDLWVYSPNKPVKILNDSGLAGNITYVKGGDSGPIQFAELKFGEYTIPSQAFINANVTDDPTQEGLIGVSFDSKIVSVIERTLRDAWGDDSTLGRTPISNLLAQNASLQPFFDVSLGRSGDLEQVTEGSLTIGTHAPGRESVAQAPVLNNVFGSGWTTYVDAMSVNGQDIPFGKSNLPFTPQGKLIAIFDTGTTAGILPSALVDAIYSRIPGSLQTDDQWLVPCAGAANVTFTIGGVEFPIHPLDLSYLESGLGPLELDDGSSTNFTVCIQRYSVADVSDTDMLLGNGFLKNAYVSFNFGTDADHSQNGSTSYMQAIPTTNREDAWTDFLISRTSALQRSPPVIDPLLYNALGDSSSGDNSTDSNSTSPSPTSMSSTAPAEPSSRIAAPAVEGALADMESAPSSGDSSALVSLLNKYSPVVIGLLAGNLLVMTLLCIIAFVACTRSAMRSGARTRNVSSNYAPVSVKDKGIYDDSTPMFKYSED